MKSRLPPETILQVCSKTRSQAAHCYTVSTKKGNGFWTKMCSPSLTRCVCFQLPARRLLGPEGTDGRRLSKPRRLQPAGEGGSSGHREPRSASPRGASQRMRVCLSGRPGGAVKGSRGQPRGKGAQQLMLVSGHLGTPRTQRVQ